MGQSFSCDQCFHAARRAGDGRLATTRRTDGDVGTGGRGGSYGIEGDLHRSRTHVTRQVRGAQGKGGEPFLQGERLVLVQDRFWGNMVSYFACDIPQYLSAS